MIETEITWQTIPRAFASCFFKNMMVMVMMAVMMMVVMVVMMVVMTMM